MTSELKKDLEAYWGRPYVSYSGMEETAGMRLKTGNLCMAESNSGNGAFTLLFVTFELRSHYYLSPYPGFYYEGEGVDFFFLYRSPSFIMALSSRNSFRSGIALHLVLSAF
jgi:hypothetical protein